jgi:hypothetical protein
VLQILQMLADQNGRLGALEKHFTAIISGE